LPLVRQHQLQAAELSQLQVYEPSFQVRVKNVAAPHAPQEIIQLVTAARGWDSGFIGVGH